MRKMGKMVALMVALMMVFSCAALAEEDTIKIGGIAPLTGTVANYGLLVQNGVNTFTSLDTARIVLDALEEAIPEIHTIDARTSNEC